MLLVGMKRERRYTGFKIHGACKSMGEEKKGRSFLRVMLSMAEAIIVTWFLLNYVFINAYVPTGSMEKTIMPGDRILGIRFFHRYSRGDVIIFKDPDGSGEYLLKRIIGLPGEKLDITKGSEGFAAISINGNVLSEDYLAEPMVYEGDFSITIPECGYFVMGDNRNASYDARYWEHKIVYCSDISGIAIIKYWPMLEFIHSDVTLTLAMRSVNRW